MKRVLIASSLALMLFGCATDQDEIDQARKQAPDMKDDGQGLRMGRAGPMANAKMKSVGGHNFTGVFEAKLEGDHAATLELIADGGGTLSMAGRIKRPVSWVPKKEGIVIKINGASESEAYFTMEGDQMSSSEMNVDLWGAKSISFHRKSS